MLWRVSQFPALDGRGGLYSDGRWHEIGLPIVYLAEHSALALLEALVHLDMGEALPPPYRLHRVEGPDASEVEHWPDPTPPPDQSTSARWGTAWLTAANTPLARVPAVVAPHAFNWLLNPKHDGAAEFKIVATGIYPWDRRLFR